LERHPSGPEGKEEKGRRQARAYQAALEAAFSIPAGLVLGWFADSRLGSAPLGLLLGIGIGFVAFILRLTRMRRMVEEEAAEAEKESGE
jgi:F0F1-type ATP synthase assembly protein I